MNTNFNTQPVSFLQQFNAWKEQMVRYQQLSGEQLPDFIKLIAVVSGLEGSVRNLVLLNLDSDSSFGDLDSLLANYVDIHDQHESSLESLCDRTCEDKPESIGKGNDTESNPSFEQQLEEGGTRIGKGKGREKGKQAKRNGEAFHPQPPAYKGKGEHAQLPREQWCSICWKKGHKTQACWWNNRQHQQQHQQPAWYTPSKPRTTTTEASQKRYQPQLYNIDQQTTYTSVLPDNHPMLSLEHQLQASTQPAYSSPVLIAQLDSFEKASSTTETWGILVDTGAATSVAAKSFASDIELSSAPATLQLTTATGKAVRTYGLKTVHLQSQGLSLEVTFVKADVVTPLLGLDSMTKDRLSLRVEHNLQHFLVNPAGDRTQLEHMGRHLYLIAWPSQHGLSPCFPGSLSQVIGFLPEDKELHEQELASRSSSSIDLDEDTRKQQVEQDSLTFQRQQVLRAAFDEKEDPIFDDLMPSKEEVADSGGELQAHSLHPHHYQQTEQPSAQDRKLHKMHHMHPAHGCVEDQEAKDRASIKTSNIQLAYAYIKQPQDCEPSLILTWLESFTGLAGSLVTAKEGPTAQQLDAVVTFISRRGLVHSTLQCDGEPALVKLVEEIGKQTGMPTRQSPASNRQLAAWQSRLFTKFRALLFDFSQRYQLQLCSVQIESSLGQYMLRHAVWLLNRFQLHESDNKTSFQR